MYQQLLTYYPIRVFTIAILAQNTIILYYLADGAYGLVANQYVYALIFQTPVWIAFIVIGEILLRLITKFNNRIILFFGAVIVLQLLVNLIQVEFNFDFLALYYVVVYMFCTTLLSYWEKKTKVIITEN
jgi:hypothetical protein